MFSWCQVMTQMSQLFFIAGQTSQSNLSISLQSFLKILDLLLIYPVIPRVSENCALYKQNKKKPI